MICREPEYVPEAAVSVRLAHWTLSLPGASHIEVALDGAHLQITGYTEKSGKTVAERVICDVREIISGWSEPSLSPWGRWTKDGRTIEIMSNPTPANADYTVCDIEARSRLESYASNANNSTSALTTGRNSSR